MSEFELMGREHGGAPPKVLWMGLKEIHTTSTFGENLDLWPHFVARGMGKITLTEQPLANYKSITTEEEEDGF